MKEFEVSKVTITGERQNPTTHKSLVLLKVKHLEATVAVTDAV